MSSPQRLFSLIALVCVLLGLAVQFPLYYLADSLLQAGGPQPVLSSDALALARHYVDTGQPALAVKQLEQHISLLEADETSVAQVDLERLLSLQENPLGQAGFVLRYNHWIWPIRFYLAATVFAFLWVGVMVYGLRGKRQLVILPFTDTSGLGIGEAIPQAVHNRMDEITNYVHELGSTHQFISEKMEMPIQGMVSEGVPPGYGCAG